MRALVLISSLVAVAFARPDVSLGYRYNQPSATFPRVSVDMVPSQSYEIPAGQSTFEHIGGSSNVASNQYVPPRVEPVNNQYIPPQPSNQYIQPRVETHFSAPATTLLTPTGGASASSSAPSVNFITYADQTAPTAASNLHTGFSHEHVSTALPSFPTLATPTGSSQLNTQQFSNSFSQGLSTGFDQGLSTGFGQDVSTGFHQGGSQGLSTGFGQDFHQGGSHITQGVAHNEEIQLTGRVDSSASHVNFPPTKVIQQTNPVVTKHTYVFAAPEEEEAVAPLEPIVLPRPQTHYKIIFIKAPSTTIVNNQAAAVAPQKDVKTIVYVLTNKRVIDRTVEVPQLPEQKHNKPEVFFIKYKTPTEKVESKAVYETVDQLDGHGAGLSPRVEANQVYEPTNVQHEGFHSEGITAVAPQQVQSFVANHPGQSDFQTLHSSSVQEVQPSQPTLTSYDSPLYPGLGSSSGSVSESQFGGSTSGSSGQFLNVGGFGQSSSSSHATNLEYIPPVGGSSCTSC